MKKFILYFKELLKTLQSIDKRLEKIEKCISDDNHRGRYAVRTSHWNS